MARNLIKRLTFTGSISLGGSSVSSPYDINQTTLTRGVANDIIIARENSTPAITLVLTDDSTLLPASAADAYISKVQETYNAFTVPNMVTAVFDFAENGITDTAEVALDAQKLNGQASSYYAPIASVLTLTNVAAYTPTLDYHPATKKYVADAMSGAGLGDMLKSNYASVSTTKVDTALNAEKLNGQLPAFYATATAVIPKVPSAVLNNIPLQNADGTLKDGAIAINDAGSGTAVLWTANKVASAITAGTTTFIPKVTGETNDIPKFAADGTLATTNMQFNDAGSTTADVWSASKITTQLGNYVTTASKGAANGVASLDGTGKVPSAQLPSYVDDVLEYANQAAFPGTGTAGIIYIAMDTNRQYRWSGSAYALISPSDVNSVNSKTGVITLTLDDIAAGSNVDRQYMTQAEHTKLGGIATGAEVNVNADWNSASGDSQILNKPTNFMLSTAGKTQDEVVLYNADGTLKQSTKTIAGTVAANGNIPTNQAVVDYVSTNAPITLSLNYANDKALAAYQEIYAGGTNDGSTIDTGWIAPMKCKITKVVFKTNTGASTGKVRIYKNVTTLIGSGTTGTDSVETLGANSSKLFTFTGLTFAQGDNIRLSFTGWSNNPSIIVFLEQIP